METLKQTDIPNPDERVYANADRSAESEQRWQVMNETVSGFQEAYPFIEGATVFGSTVHGGATETSGIDAFVFVDPEQLPEEVTTLQPDGSRAMTERDQKDMGRALQADIMAGLGVTVTKNGDFEKNDVKIVPINEALAKQRAEQLVAASAEYDTISDTRYDQRQAVLDEIYADETKQDWTYEQTEAYVDERLGPAPQLPSASEAGLTALFRPAAGDATAVAAMRRAVVESLPDGQYGEEVWSDISSTVMMLEGRLHMDPDGEALFPEDLEQARLAYAA